MQRDRCLGDPCGNRMGHDALMTLYEPGLGLAETTRARVQWKLAGLVTLGGLAAHLVWLGWSQPGPEYNFDSPPLYETWQVIGLFATTWGVAVVAGLYGANLIVILLLPAASALAFAVDQVTGPYLWFWFIGASGILVVCFIQAIFAFWVFRRRRHGSAQR